MIDRENVKLQLRIAISQAKTGAKVPSSAAVRQLLQDAIDAIEDAEKPRMMMLPRQTGKTALNRAALWDELEKLAQDDSATMAHFAHYRMLAQALDMRDRPEAFDMLLQLAVFATKDRMQLRARVIEMLSILPARPIVGDSEQG
jgi:hypothetical protein